MNVEEEIEAAVYCLRREYRGEISEEMIEQVVADIRRQHREAMINSITGFFRKVGNTLSDLYRLLASPFAVIAGQPRRG
ncbi:MAG TPA: hypothetical protein VF219_22715 [Vicinamibacterales bacterium]